MAQPYVYIEQEPFVNMVLASIETFRRECFGLVFGTMPSRSNNFYHVTNAVAIQLAKKRVNKEIEQSKMSKKRMMAIIRKYGQIYPLLGDFHSHPEWGLYRREPNMSDSDLRDMRKENFDIGIVLKIQLINKERNIWESAPDGGIRGSIGDYKIHLNTVRLDEDGEEEVLQIKASAAVKALNRAIGYT